MPFIKGDRVTVTDPSSTYYGKFGTVTRYWSDLECPVVDVILDDLFGTATFNETSIAIGEYVVRPLPEYEYNIKVHDKVFYTVWSTEKEMLALWKVESLDNVNGLLQILQPTGKLVRRIKTEIEDV